MLPVYISFIGKMRVTHSYEGVVLHRKHCVKHNSIKNIMGEEQIHGITVGRNLVL